MDISEEDRDWFLAHSLVERRVWFRRRVPRFLYKYRALPRVEDDSAALDLRSLEGLLVRNEVFFSSPLIFNDLHEGIVGFDLVSDPEAIQSAYEALRLRREKASPGSTVGVELQQEWLAGDQALLARFHSAFSDGLAKAGVFSLSADPRSPPLWAYYGSDGAGVCVQFAVQEDPTLVLAQQVDYEQRKPSFDLMKALKNDGLADELMQHLTTKGSEWSHEREWRLLHGRARDLVVLQPPAVSGLILGPRITEFGISKLRHFLEQRKKNGLPPVRTYSANPDTSRFPLKILSRRR